MDIQRKAFEAEFRKTDFYKMNLVNCFCFINDRYVWDEVQAAWEMWQAAKAEAVPEKDAIIKKLSDQLYSQEMKTSAARTLCETACELLDDYAHQDAMVILNDLEQAMIEAQEQKG